MKDEIQTINVVEYWIRRYGPEIAGQLIMRLGVGE